MLEMINFNAYPRNAVRIAMWHRNTQRAKAPEIFGKGTGFSPYLFSLKNAGLQR